MNHKERNSEGLKIIKDMGVAILTGSWLSYVFHQTILPSQIEIITMCVGLIFILWYRLYLLEI